MASIFTKIVNGEIPCYKVAESDEFLAFLDINPNSKGHTLCIPKKEVDRIFDLDADTYNGLMSFSRMVGKAIESTVDCERVGISVIGLEVPHVHVHLVPMNSMNDINFSKGKLNPTDEELKNVASKIKSNLD
jgi:histidine triad (HIT) family protein